MAPALSTLASAPQGTPDQGSRDPVVLTFPKGRPMGQGLELALRVARSRGASLRVVRPVVLPRQTSLEVDDPRIIGPHQEALDAVVESGSGRGVEVTGIVRKGHDLAAVVAEDAAEAGAGLVLAPGRPPLGEMGGVSKGAVESLLDQVGCQVVVYGEPPAPSGCDRIGVAVAGGPHTPAMASFAPLLARTWDASILLFHVLDPDDSAEDRNEARDLLDRVGSDLPEDPDVDRKVVEDADVIAAVLEEARASDAWILGAPTRSRWRHFLYGSRARKVQRDAPSWTFVVHEPER